MKEENIKRIIARRLSPHLDLSVILKMLSAHAGDNKTNILVAGDVIGFDIDELGDEYLNSWRFSDYSCSYICRNIRSCGLCGLPIMTLLKLK